MPFCNNSIVTHYIVICCYVVQKVAETKVNSVIKPLYTYVKCIVHKKDRSEKTLHTYGI